MKFAIDRIENNIAILENLKTKEKKEISIQLLPSDIKEGMIIIKNNNKYYIDKDEEIKRRKRIITMFNKLKL